MKYLLAIALSTIVIGLLVSLSVTLIFGENYGYFFVRYLSMPTGGICSVILFMMRDQLWPKK